MIYLVLIFVFLFPRPSLATEPTITDFWNQRAQFKYSFSLTGANVGWTAGFDAGVHVEVVGSNWYLFTRHVSWGLEHPGCQQEKMYTEIRQSTDQGKTWSPATPAITNTPNTPWECVATDGDAFYNPAENRWHYLFQCLGKTGGWSGCHATRDGADPYGPFTPSASNPVINPSEIWSKICTNPNSDCYQLAHYPTWKIFDEGTYDIFDYQDGYYLVSFHGTDGIRGYRGIAKTSNFQDWEPINHDSTLDLKDALSFTTPWDSAGPIGFGAGSIIKDEGYYYLISEAADKNLACTNGQNWVWGMFRSSNVNSTNWEQLPSGNPFFTQNNFPDTNPSNLPCYPEYLKIFTDSSGKTFLHAGRPSYDANFFGIYFYQLAFTGDTNDDGRTDLIDFVLWKQEYSGQSNTKKADYNSDHKVDLLDFTIWKQAYSSLTPQFLLD